MNPNHIIHSEPDFHPDPSGDITPNRPLRAAYLTTLDEIVPEKGGEFVGRQPYCDERQEHLDEIRKGNLQALAEAIRNNVSGLGDAVEIAFVGYSDTKKTMSRLSLDPSIPFEQGNWPWPHDLPAAAGQTVHDVTQQVPMSLKEYRRLRKQGNLEAALEARRQTEQQLVDLLVRAGTDFVLTDSWTYIFQDDMPMLETFANRIINFHPAVTRGDRALPGLYPTSSAIERFRRGVRFGDRRAEVPVPELKGLREHGATVHMTIAKIDAGRVVYSSADPNMIDDGETQQTLRSKVFQHGHGVLIEGVRRFVQHQLRQEATQMAHTPPALRTAPPVSTPLSARS